MQANQALPCMFRGILISYCPGADWPKNMRVAVFVVVNMYTNVHVSLCIIDL